MSKSTYYTILGLFCSIINLCFDSAYIKIVVGTIGLYFCFRAYYYVFKGEENEQEED